ncbi:MAG: tRNA pseudouridine(55) synthase [Acidobacteria bacterium]|nr:MAG: tRNA pseudouridine(55) synthase [Acidobacteriota bacterium]
MDAVLVIDKPAGLTSHDVVARVRRLLGERSVGHLGTLDPMATGVLPLLTGRFTRFSAKKIAGVPAYKLARKDRDVKLKKVKVFVHRFEIQNLEGDHARFTAEVSAGTYVRGLADELGQKLGVGAHLADLRRTCSGEFTLDQAVTLERLSEIRKNGLQHERNLPDSLSNISLHPRQILPQIPSVTVNDETAGLIGNGRAVNLPEFSGARQVKVFLGEEELIAIASRIAGTLFQPKVVLRAA